MRMSKESYAQMNQLLGKCFNANAVIDNLAYSLDFHYFNEIAKVVHLRVAHIMPEWADLISDKMLELSARPVRVDIKGYAEDYEDLQKVFSVLHETVSEILEDTRKLVGAADLNGDDEVRIFCEEFLMRVSPFVKQAEEWQNAAELLDPQTLNIHINQYTHFIEL